MGWSWALHICQQVLSNAISIAGFDEHHVIVDKRRSVSLSKSEIAAGYVDNYGVFGTDPDLVNQGPRRISSVLRGWGLTVHELEDASLEADFVGLHFNGKGGLFLSNLGASIKSSQPLTSSPASSFVVAGSPN